MKNILSSLIVLLVTFSVFSQEITQYATYNSNIIEDDLLSVSIDNLENKWVGTSKNGLVKYTDSTFVTINKPLIKGKYISPVFTDSKGYLWISYSGIENGIAKFNGIEWEIYPLEELPIKNNSIITIAENNNGDIYFGGTNGVIIYKNNSWSKLILPQEKTYTVRAIDISNEGIIAIGHNEGLLLLKNKQWEFYSENNSELQLDVVRSVKFSDNGELYIGYGGGLGKGGFSIFTNNSWKHYNMSNSKLPNQMVRDIEFADNGRIWMATNDGIFIIDTRFDIWTPIKLRKGEYQNVIMDISIDKNNVAWVATNFGLIKLNLY